MSAHSEIVRSYIELRNYLAKSNPQANMEFEIHFKISNSALLAFSSQSKASVELAKVRPTYPGIFMPHYGCPFHEYATDLIQYVNKHLRKEPTDTNTEILKLTVSHKSSLNLRRAYEPN